MFAEEKLASMSLPDEKTLEAFRFTFFNGRPGDIMSFPTLGGNSISLYDDADDLVAVKILVEQDRLSILIQNHLAFLFKVGHPSFFSLPLFLYLC